MRHTPRQHGFIALIAIICMSVVLLTTTLSLAQFGIANRFFILNLEHKIASEKLGDACVHVARVSVYNDPLYTVSSAHPITIPIHDSYCTITSITYSGNESMIEVEAVQKDARTQYRVVIDSTNGDFLSWEELE
jgi:hypothetical protein